MLICHCRRVTDRGVCAAIDAGARDAAALASKCGAGGGCGGCLPALQALLASYGLMDAVDHERAGSCAA